MASKAGRIYLLYIYFSLSNAFVSEHYQATIDLDNKLSIHLPVDSQHSKSTLRCAWFCVTAMGAIVLVSTPRQRCVGFIFRVTPRLGQLMEKDGDHTATVRYNL